MCEPTLEEIKRQFGVAELEEPTPKRLRELMRNRGAGERLLSSMWEDGVFDIFVAICVVHCEDLLIGLRQERFAQMLASSMEDDAMLRGDGAREMIIPVFAELKSEGASAVDEAAREIGRLMGAFHFEVASQLEEGAEPAEEIAKKMGAVLDSVLDFLPRPAHAPILSAQQMFLLRAVDEGIAAFAEEDECEELVSLGRAKSI